MPTLFNVLLAIIVTFVAVVGINFLRHKIVDENPPTFREFMSDFSHLFNRKDLTVIAFAFCAAFAIPYAGARITHALGYETFAESYTRVMAAQNK